MANNELKIKIVGTLDSAETKSNIEKDISKLKLKKKDSKVNLIGSLNAGLSIKEINTAIKGIEKKVNPIKLKIDVDDKMLKSIAAFQKQMKSLQDQAEKVNKVVSEISYPDGKKVKVTTNNGTVDKTIVTEMEKINQSNKKVQQSSKLAGDAISTQKTAIERLRREFEKLDSTTKSYDKTNKLLGSTLKATSGNGARKLSANLDSDGNIKGFSIKTDLTRQQKEFERYQKQVVNGLSQIEDKNKVTASSFQRLNNAFNLAKTEKEMKRVLDLINRINSQYKQRKGSQDFVSVKQDSLSALEKFYKNNERAIKSNKELHQTFFQTRSGVKSWSKDMKDAELVAKQFQTQMKNLKAQVAEASRTNIGIVSAFNTAMVWKLAV